ncbi:cytochrome-c oxidase, cbb3-type subunit III [Tropicimonas isoalkanivorans]|uniref:Cbb3-type cytochrome c oxidase subunit n=1 Tax=Tropicimonas isoalkanivorans TaxID=441112 RepID=A0A1I1QRD8_9RHOB|nr:cytochrome-c oxidase, cbb3-type subunit III [Tropicimonas isoalkanivorans]SFD24681.1 cytochrome c oxidase cbb3-type subunit 3 [Tropicimonas isoalkanivorans]
MSKKPVKKEKNEVETTGHSWDGIEEYNNPLPRWWLWTFYATVVWALIYTILYPAWPLVNHATAGLLGHSTRANVAAEMARFEDANADIKQQLVDTELADIPNNPELMSYAQNAGAAVFRTWCAQCHGAGAQGQQSGGYPSLLDDSWLWGGTIDEIHTTISYGIRYNDESRFGDMLAFGRDELLSPEEIDQVIAYVQQISAQDHDQELASAGETIFLDNCASCHGDDGTGDIAVGAPNLTDAIWLYGGDPETLHETLQNGRGGVMPPRGGAPADVLDEAMVRAVATYVHSLGGGVAEEQ